MRHLIITLIALILSFNAWSQSGDKSTTRLQLAYFHDHTQSQYVVATLKVKDVSYVPYQGAEIEFYSVGDTSRVLLSKATTNKKGEATYILGKDDDILMGPEGQMRFEAEYAGTATTKASSNDLEVLESELKISFYQEDSAKFIDVQALAPTPDDALIPIADLPVAIYIKGTFSLLKIGDEVTDESGKAKLAFPVNMPGDSLGVLTITARVEDNDTYGNVEARGNINWATPVPIPEPTHRGLGDTDAPLWMVYTLIILLSAVWFHYLYVIFLIYKIKRARRNIAAEVS